MTPSSGGRGCPDDRLASSSSNRDAGYRNGPTVAANGPRRRRWWAASAAAMGGRAGGKRLASSNNRSTAALRLVVTLYLRKSEVSFRPIGAELRGPIRMHAVRPTGG